ncbi:lipid-A-disaccharide synthase, partial [bacterium]|nr:lipid-A-disaccharide synthase [bacterium]
REEVNSFTFEKRICMGTKSVLIIAGEVSGDMHGANLIREMKKSEPDLCFWGIGGERMKQEGVELLYHINRMSLIGLTEVIKHIPFVCRVINRIAELVEEKKPQVVILIDYPGFNVRLGKRLKKAGCKIFYYISPQVWAWGKGRIKKIAGITDKMAVILPFEEDIYKKAGIDAVFVGHPLVDTAKTEVTREEFYKTTGLTKDKITIGLLPGSRIQEIETLLPEMLKSLHSISETAGNVQGVVSMSPTIDKEIYDEIISMHFPIPLIPEYNYPIMRYCDILVIASGTATLEAAVIGTPMIIVYRVSPVTYFFAKLLVKIPYIGLANIIAQRQIIPELIQRKSLAGDITAELEKMLANPAIGDGMRKELNDVKKKLGSPGASKRAAKMAVELMNS